MSRASSKRARPKGCLLRLLLVLVVVMVFVVRVVFILVGGSGDSMRPPATIRGARSGSCKQVDILDWYDFLLIFNIASHGFRRQDSRELFSMMAATSTA